VRVTKKSQEVPEQPGPVYAEVQPGTSDAHLAPPKLLNAAVYSQARYAVTCLQFDGMTKLKLKASLLASAQYTDGIRDPEK